MATDEQPSGSQGRTTFERRVAGGSVRPQLMHAYLALVVLAGIYMALMVIAGTDVLGARPDHHLEWGRTVSLAE